jgi:hypothetical protein
MIDTLLSLIGLGQFQSHRSVDLFAVASSHLASIEKICLKTVAYLNYEIPRLSRLAEGKGGASEEAIDPLVKMAQQNEQLSELVATNRELLQKKSANPQIVAELERCAERTRSCPNKLNLRYARLKKYCERHRLSSTSCYF